MIKALSHSLLPILKWTSVAAASAAVVISIQANAISSNAELSNAALDASTSDVKNSLIAEPALASNDDKAKLYEASKVAALKTPWTPANGFADLIEGVSPAVVHVSTEGFIRQRSLGRRGGRGQQDFGDIPSQLEDLLRRYGIPSPRQQQPQAENDQEEDDSEKKTQPLGIGSGFIISADGYVVTNHHVIDRADKIIVTLTDGTEYEATIKGSDPRTDLALLKLKDAKKLPYVPWGNDKASRVGDWVLAIGNPFGLGGSASTGIISAIGRDINAGPYDDFIQVDAAINRGNSGGPLFNMSGEVIGINSMIYSPTGGSVGIGFSIPASLAKGVIGQLQKTGGVQRGWIGVSIGQITEDLAALFKRPNQEGALISQVLPDSPAQKSGIKAGDIILKFNGERIKEVRDLPKAVAQADVGSEHKVQIWRKGKKQTIKIVTEAFPSDTVASEEPEEAPVAKVDTDEDLGADFAKLNDANRSQFRIADDVEGVLVVSVESGGLAEKNGLRAGDVIVQFGISNEVQGADDITRAYKEAKKAGDDSIAVLISRRNGNGFLGFELK